jgi:RHS repeat-associated protein
MPAQSARTSATSSFSPTAYFSKLYGYGRTILARRRAVFSRAMQLEQLERRQYMSVVVGKQLFYNNSAFDGFTPGPDAQDDAAIAPDKVALSAAQTATFANYSSYSRGINGVMVDVQGGSADFINKDDFEFYVGNSPDASYWVKAADPTSITVRKGAGKNGSDRVTILWEDGAIQKQWLQVVVLSTPNTGLSEPDIFYFGSTPGETGNDPNGTRVNGTDEILTRFNPHTLLNPASITDPYDFNRDKKVDASDQLVARNNQTNLKTDLMRLNPTVSPPGLPRVQMLSSTVARINWYDSSLEDRETIVEASENGGQFKEVAIAARNDTATVVTGLKPNTNYTFRLTQIGPSSSMSGSSTVDGHTTALSPSDPGGWFHVSIGGLNPGEKTYTEQLLTPFTALDQWVYAADWRQAVYKVVSGSIKITNTGQQYTVTAGQSLPGAFKVDTAGNLAVTTVDPFSLLNNPLPADAQVLVLEDTYTLQNDTLFHDVDYDDFYWNLQVTKRVIGLDAPNIWLPVNFSHDELNTDSGGGPAADNEFDATLGDHIVSTDPDLRDAKLYLPQEPGYWKLEYPDSVRVYQQVGTNWVLIPNNTEMDMVQTGVPVNLKMEGIFASLTRNGTQIKATFRPVTGTSVNSTLSLTVMGTDVDVDSNNDNKHNLPDFDNLEERIEGDSSKLGKVVYSVDPTRTPLSIEFMGPSNDIASAKFNLTYSSAGFPGSPLSGTMRVWKNATGTGTSDFLAPGVYTGAQLGLSATTKNITFYIQGVNATTTAATRLISVQLDPDGTGPAGYETSDGVYITVDTRATLPGDITGYKWNDLNNNSIRDAQLIKTPPNAIWVIDVSGSTSSNFKGDTTGDVNGDGMSTTILDGEISAYLGLNQYLVDQGYTEANVAIVAFGTSAKLLDLDPGPGFTLNPGSSLAAALSGIHIGLDGQVGETTNYEAGLQQTLKAARQMLGSQKNLNIFFLSDGYPYPDTSISRYVDEVAAFRGPEFRDAQGNSRIYLRAFGAGLSSNLDYLIPIDDGAIRFTNSTPLLRSFDGSVGEFQLYSEPGLPGWNITAFKDTNGNGVLDTGEPRWTAQTKSDGTYVISGLDAGVYVVQEEPQAGWNQTFPQGGGTQLVTLGADGVVTGNFGNRFVGQPNLVIDSDNNNGFGLPDNSAQEDQLEDWQGKTVYVNNGNTDNDSHPDYADFDAGAKFTPLLLDISGISSLNLTNATVRFTYSGSDPTKLSNDTPAPGFIRIWRKDGDVAHPVSDYIKPDAWYRLDSFTLSNNKVEFFVEGISPTLHLYDGIIRVDIDADGTGPGRFNLQDSVLVDVDPRPVGSGTINGHVFRDRNKNTQWDGELILGQRPDVIMVIDASHSTVSVAMQGSAIGDINGDNITLGADKTTVLDAEIAGYIALTQQLIDLGYGATANVAIVPFGTALQAIDLRPDVPGDQYSTTPAADLDHNGVSDIIDALKRIRDDNGSHTNPGLGLQKAMDLLNEWGSARENANVFVMSDGFYDPENVGPAAALRARVANFRGYGIGPISSIDNLKAIDPQASRLLQAEDVLGALGGLGGGGPIEEGLGGWTVFNDTNNNAVLDPGEVSAISQSDGSYTLSNVPTGNIYIRIIMNPPVPTPPTWIQTAPRIAPPDATDYSNAHYYYDLTLADGQSLDRLNFGVLENVAAPTSTGLAFTSSNGFKEGSPIRVTVNNPSGYTQSGLFPLVYSFDLNNDGDFIDDGEIYRSISPFMNFTVDDGPSTIAANTIHVRINDSFGNASDFYNTAAINVQNAPPGVVIRFLGSDYDYADFGGGGPHITGVILDASTADSHAPFSYEWILKRNGTLVDTQTGTTTAGQNTLPYEFLPIAGPGTYTLEFRALDKDGNPAVTGDWGSTTKTVVVHQTTPIITSVSNPSPVTGTIATLHVVATDDLGEEFLRYFWEVDRVEDVQPDDFDVLGTNAAKDLAVHFLADGDYEFTVYAVDDDDNFDVSTVTVHVAQTATKIEVVPHQASVDPEGFVEFNANLFDQFGNPMSLIDEQTTWALDGTPIGSLDETGLYTAPASQYGVDVVRASFGSITATAQILVVNPANYGIIGAASSYNIDEGGDVGSDTHIEGQGLAGFVDSKPGTSISEYSATVDWDISDATGPESANLASITLEGGVQAWEVYKHHVYDKPGTYTFRVTLTHDDGTVRTKSVDGQVVVTAAGIHYQFFLFNPVSGQQFSGTVFRFASDDPTDAASAFSADIVWGDTSTQTNAPIAASTSLPGYFEISGTHTYNVASTTNKIVKIILRKNGTAFFPTGQEPSQSIQVTVPNAENYPIVGAGASFGAGAGVAFGTNQTPGNGIAAFVDSFPGTSLSQYTAKIDWGDGSPIQNGTIGTFTIPGTSTVAYEIFGSHAYTNAGAYSAIITLTHVPTNRSATATASIEVATGAVGYQFLASNFIKGQAFSSAVLRFDSGNPSDTAGMFTATIDWGDGSGVLTANIAAVSGQPGFFTVTGAAAHTYQILGFHTITVSLTRSGSAFFTADAPVRVQPQSLTTPTITGGFVVNSTAIGIEWNRIPDAEYVLWAVNKKTGVKRRIPLNPSQVTWFNPTDHDPAGTVYTVDQQLPSNTTFIYTIQAVYPDGSVSPESAPFEYATPAPVQVPPPSNLTGRHLLADSLGTTPQQGVQLYWNSTPTIGGYRVFRRELLNGDWVWRDLISNLTTLDLGIDTDWKETVVPNGGGTFDVLDPTKLADGGKMGWFDPFVNGLNFTNNTTPILYAIVGYDAPAGEPLTASTPAIVSVYKDITAPSRPTGLRGGSFPEAIQLTWDDHPVQDDADWAGWNVYRIVGGVPFKLNTRLITDELGYNDYTAPIGATSHYLVRSVDTLGNESEAAEIDVRRSLEGEPGAPTGLIARANGIDSGLTAPNDAKIQVTWDAVTPTLVHATDAIGGYDVERLNGTTWTRLRSSTDTGGNSTTFDDTGRTRSTTYSYRVRAVDQDGDYSAWVIVSTSSGNGIAPAAPTLVSKEHLSTASIKLIWTGPVGANYRVYRSTNSSTGFALVPKFLTDNNATQLIDEGLASSTTYYYKIFAVDSDGDLSTALAVTQDTESLATDERPTLRITNVTANATLSADTKIRGIIDDPNNNLASWQLILRPVSAPNNPADVIVASGTTELGQDPNIDAQLAKLQPTLYLNGAYQLILRGIESITDRETESTPILVKLQTEVKVGNFTIPFQDFSVNIPGAVSITVTRVYDSANANNQGDFGYGWRLDVSNTQLRMNTTPSKRETSTPTVRFGDQIRITIPGQGEHVFQFMPKPSTYEQGASWPLLAVDPLAIFYAGDTYTAQFVCIDGSSTKLALTVGTQLRYDRDAKEFFDILSNEPFNPASDTFGGQFILTTLDGEKYTISAESGDLVDRTDANGNITRYEDGTIKSGNKTLTIHRDQYNRVDWISMDPTGLGPRVSYEYSPYIRDASQNIIGGGDLIAVVDASDRRSEFGYTDPAHRHFLTKLIDSRGTELVKVTYDSAGKVTQVKDVRNVGAPVSHGGFDGRTGSNTVTDLSGNRTESIYNDHGDVIRDITEVRDDAGQLIKYIILVSDYQYVGQPTSGDIYDMMVTGSTRYNKRVSETHWQMFEILGSDPAGLRYTTRPDAAGAKIASQMGYYVNEDPSEPENGMLATQTTLASDGVTLLTTTYAGYENGRPTHVTDPYGNDFVNDYDNAGNLLSTQIVSTGETTYYSYTAGASYTYADGTTVNYTDLPKGLMLESWQLRPDGPDADTDPDHVTLIKNVYYAGVDASERDWGRLKNTIDTNGITQYFSYDARGRVELTWRLQTDPTLGTVRIETQNIYDTAGRLSRIVEGRVVSQATGQVLSPGAETSSVFDLSGSVLAVINMYGGKTISTYDAGGKLVRTLYPDNTEVRTVYNEMGKPLWISERFASSSAYTLNQAAGTITWSSNDNSSTYLVTYVIYDDFGRVIGTERYKNAKIDIVGDLNGTYKTVEPSRTALIGAGNRLAASTTTYDASGRPSEVTSPDGLRAGTIYYANGQPHYTGEIVSLPTGQTPAAPYLIFDAASNSFLVRYSERRFDLTDADSRYDQVTDANGHLTKTYKDDAGRAVRNVFDDGTHVDDHYEAYGQKTYRIDQLGRRTDYEYDLAGHLIAVTLPSIQIENPQNAGTLITVRPRTEYTYDATGNQTAIVSNAYLTSDGTTVVYLHKNSSGNDVIAASRLVTQAPLLAGQVTRYTYDLFGRQLTRQLPLGRTERSEYDPIRNQRTLHVSFEGVVTQLIYDNSPSAGGRIQQKRYFPTEAAYQAFLANPTANPPQQTLTYHYDALGRLDQIADSLNGTYTTTYDPITGAIIKSESTEGAVFYEYDTATAKLLRTYTGAQDSAHNSVASDGKAVTDTRYTYDQLGRLKTVKVYERNDVPLATPETSTYYYDAVGNLDALVQPNNVVTDYHYDTLNRLTLLESFVDADSDRTFDTGETLLARYTYLLNDDGSRKQSTEIDSQGNQQTFYWGYDSMGRLISEARDAVGTSDDTITKFTYDLVGNRLKQEDDSADGSAPNISGFLSIGTFSADRTVSYTYDDDDRILKEVADATGTANDTNTAYQYGTGNTSTQQKQKVIRDGLTGQGSLIATHTFDYNLEGQLKTVTIQTAGTTTTVQYRYDATGIRVEQSINDGTTTVTYTYRVDPNNPTGTTQVLEEYVNGQLNKTYTLGLDVVAQTAPSDAVLPSGVAAGDPLTLLYDGHGSTRALLDGINVIQRYAFSAYGVSLAGTGLTSASSALTSLLYSGEQFDSRVGLQYLRARYYSPSLGRFTTMDPGGGSLNDPRSLHRYLYAVDNPIMAADPSGLLAYPTLLTGVGIGALLMALLLPALGGARMAGQWVTANVTWTHRVSVGGVTLADYIGIADAAAAGLQQGIVNVFNGVQDAAIGLLNLGIMASPTGLALMAAGKSPFIPSPDWSAGLFVEESERAHWWSKFIGGQGAMTLLTLGLTPGGSVATTGAEAATSASANTSARAAEVLGEFRALNLPKPPPNASIFWQGGREGARAAADAVPGGMTLERWMAQTPEGAQLFARMEALPAAESGPVWRAVSQSFAENSSGVVRVFTLGTNHAEFLESIWMTVEFPALLQNPAVTAFWNIAKTLL